MKKKIHKILGVGLALVFAFSTTFAFSVPAMAAEDEWDIFEPPDIGSDGDWFMDNATVSIGPFARAIDGTFYLYMDHETAASDDLYISDDDGRTWEATGYATDFPAAGAIVDIACSTEDADVLYVATATNVYKSDEEGDTDSWENLGNPDSADTITCLAVGYEDENPHIYVGEAGGFGEVWYYEDAPFASIWIDLDVAAPDNDGAVGVLNVWGIAVSPDFENDTLVVAVTANATGSFVIANVGAGIGVNDWDDLELLNDATTPVAFVITEATNPVFVEDFDIDDDYELFVGVSGPAHETSGLGAVYRITGTSEDDDFLMDDVDDDVASLDLVGDLGGVSLLAGTTITAPADAWTGPASIWYSTDDGDDWDETDKAPTGRVVTGDDFIENLVIVDEDFADSGEAWCASYVSDGGKEGGVHLTTDFGASWNGISMLDTNMGGDEGGAIYDIAFTADYGTDDAPMFMVAQCSENISDDNVWMYDGTNWERVWYDDTNELNMVEVSPAYAEDTAVFIAASAAPTILYSHDGSATFDEMIRQPDEDIAAWVVIDDETIITGDANGDYWKTTRYGRRIWDDDTICEDEPITDFALSPNYAADGTILAGNDDSEVFISTDEGEEWDEVSASDIEGWTDADNDTYVAFDPRYADNYYIYAVSDDTWGRVEIISGEDVGDLEFDVIYDWAGSGADEGFSGLVVSDDGIQAGEHEVTLYMSTGVDPATGVETGVWRSLNPAAEDLDDVIDDFELVSAGLETGTAAQDFSPVVGAIRNLELASGSNVLYIIDTVTVEVLPDVIYTYEDTLAAPVVLSSPADEAKLEDTDRIQFEWEELNSTTVDFYEVEVNEEDDFPTATDAGIGAAIDDTEYTWREDQVDLDPEGGTVYYWRVRVSEGGPVLSRWSEEWSAMTKVEEVEEPVDVVPLPGATGVILLPTFAWKAVTGADLYDIEVATDPLFEDIVAAGTPTINTWASDVGLSYSTIYYWRVRGISSTGAPEGDWIISSFTTMAKPAVAPPPVEVEVPPAQPVPQITVETIVPITPAYVWAIIAIGALLIIALIVLIVRTRRVV